jgi:hypothetical protein
MNLTMNPPATAIEVDLFKQEFKLFFGNNQIPTALLETWTKSDGFYGDYVIFYSTSEIIERNEICEVKIYSPSFIVVADDGGGKVALLQLGILSNIVYLNYSGNMSIKSMESTNMDLDTWIESGCPFDLAPTPIYLASERVKIQLDKMPQDGLRDLIRIKKILLLDNISIRDLKEIENFIPYNLFETSYIKALRYASEINKVEECVSIWKVSDPIEKMPLDHVF